MGRRLSALEALRKCYLFTKSIKNNKAVRQEQGRQVRSRGVNRIRRYAKFLSLRSYF